PARSTLFPYTTLFRSFAIGPDFYSRATRGSGSQSFILVFQIPFFISPFHGRFNLSCRRQLFRHSRQLARSRLDYAGRRAGAVGRSEEHTSELQSRENL